MHLAATPLPRPSTRFPLPTTLYHCKYCQLFGIFIIAQTFMVVDGAGIAQGVAERGGWQSWLRGVRGVDCNYQRVQLLQFQSACVWQTT